MRRLSENKIILVTRPTRLAELVVRFNTVSQARFYVEHQGADFQDYLREDEIYHRAKVEAQSTLSRLGRVQVVDRGFLPNFVFGDQDSIVTLGQDGLVANTMKYLDGQPVVAVNPDPSRWDGKLLPFKVGDLKKVMSEVFARSRPTKSVTMAKASLNSGQVLYAVNDLFIGPRSHTSARYLIRSGDVSEPQSSSGIVVSTGMGSTGWLTSLLAGASAIAKSTGSLLRGPDTDESRDGLRKGKGRSRVRDLPKAAFAWDANYILYTVREPFPSATTRATLVCGQVTSESPLEVESQMPERGVIFSDGIEQDFLEFNSGASAVISIAERKGLVIV